MTTDSTTQKDRICRKSVASSVTSNKWGDIDQKLRDVLYRIATRDGYFQNYLYYFYDLNRFEVFTAWNDEGQPIACLWLEWTKPGKVALCGVYVKYKYRRKGIGTLLMDRATADYPNVRFRTYHWNPASRAFFLQKKKRCDHDTIVTKVHI